MTQLRALISFPSAQESDDVRKVSNFVGLARNILQVSSQTELVCLRVFGGCVPLILSTQEEEGCWNRRRKMQRDHEGASVAHGVRCGSTLPDLVGSCIVSSVKMSDEMVSRGYDVKIINFSLPV